MPHTHTGTQRSPHRTAPHRNKIITFLSQQHNHLMSEPGAPYMSAWKAKMKNRKPPAMATRRWLILSATMRPPTTASPVQHAWPMMAPAVTPYGSLCAASAMVVIWLRSPHSARKVSTNASRKMGVHTRLSTRRMGPGRATPIFSSTSDTSSTMDALGSLRHAMYSSRNPKNVYSTNAALLTVSWLSRLGTTRPSMVDSTVITDSALSAPARMMKRGWRIAMMAAMMNVSSPSSDTRIMVMDDTNASLKPPCCTRTAAAAGFCSVIEPEPLRLCPVPALTVQITCTSTTSNAVTLYEHFISPDVWSLAPPQTENAAPALTLPPTTKRVV
mmetsp:Transcript_14849/g.35844  ORF Transcript_14849/g.35844 Transcript_14849/m.35844 type:complete len:329 (-) Transcript_14849:157-1143(-)